MVSGKKIIIWQPRAGAELFAILDFLEKRNGSTEYGERLFERIEHRLSLISKDWLLGEKVNRENVRRTTVDYYQVYYLIKADSIDILSIRDARRKPKRFVNKK